MKSPFQRRPSRDWSREILPAAPGTSPPHTESSITIRDLLTVVLRYKILIVSTFLVTILATLVALWMRDPSYETDLRILIKYGRDASGNPRASLSQNSARISQAPLPDINSEAEMLKSYWLAKKVVEELHLDVKKPKPVPVDIAPRIKYELKRLSGEVTAILDQIQFRLALKEEVNPKDRAIVEVLESLKVEGVKDSSIVHLTLTTKFREGAGVILNRLAHHYREHRMSIEKNPAIALFFDGQAADYSARLKNSEFAFAALKTKAEISSLPEQLGQTARSIAEAELAQWDTGTRLAEAQSQFDLLQKQVIDEKPRVTLEEVAGRNALLDSLLEKKSDLVIERQKLAIKVTDSDPRLVDLDSQIAHISKLLSDADSEVGRSRTTGENSVYVDLRKQLATALRTRDATQARFQSQVTTLVKLRDRLRQLQALETTYSQLVREVETNAETYKLHLRNSVESRSAEALNAAGITSISLLDQAVDPVTPVGTRRVYIFLGALAGGLVLGLALAFFFEAVNQKISNPEQVVERLGAPVLGAISRMNKRDLDLPSNPITTGELRAMLSRVDLSLSKNQGRILVVLGANPEAGASFLSHSLARGFAAQSGTPTLLVSVEAAGSDLSTSSTVEDLDKNLSHLTCRLPDGASTKDLSALNLIQDVDNHKRIVLDLSSMIPREDQFQIAASSDATLVAVESERTPKEVLVWLKGEVERLKIPLVGAVLNKQRHYIPAFIYPWL